MKKGYLSIGYANSLHLHAEIEAIRQILNGFQISLYVFVNKYQFPAHEEKQMMQQAFADIDASDLIIAEVSEKAIGVGIEIGYAVARQKIIVYLRSVHAEHSTTTAGSADYSILYENIRELSEKLILVITAISHKAT